MISILMPVYNAQPYLAECLDSICAQTAQDWELIAVDDFSSDDSLALLHSYCAKDNRIQVLQNKEKGIISALRIGLATSSGEYITRMDADDIMPERKLEILLDACQPNSIATGKVSYFRSDGELGDGYRAYAEWLNGLVEHGTHWQEIYKECVIPSPAWIMRRENLNNIGAFDAEAYPEDYDLAFRAYKAGLAVHGVDEIVHHWRDHSERASRNDSNYSDNRFLALKLHYFLLVDYSPERTLAVWGAGRKGKHIARYLIDQEISFTWHTDNAKKLGVNIYGMQLKSSSEISNSSDCLIAIAGEAQQAAVRARLKSMDDVSGVWMC